MSSISVVGAGAADPRSYETAVHNLLAGLANDKVGSAVLEALRAATRSDRHVWIAPYALAGRPADPENAVARPGILNVTTTQDLANSAPAGQPVLNCGGYRGRTGVIGTGAGVAATVLYSPGMFAAESRCAGLYCRGAGAGRSEALLHELVHALRILSGRSQCVPMGAASTYPDEEEFYAVLVVDIYASSNHRPLRFGYDGGFDRDVRLADGSSAVPAGPNQTPVEPAQIRPPGGLQMRGALDAVERPVRPRDLSMLFARRHEELLQKLWRQLPGLCRSLASLGSAEYNPLRDSQPQPAVPGRAGAGSGRG